MRRKTRLAELLQAQSEITWRKAKGYDAIAAYEKRLVTIASGDSVVKAASKAQKAQDKVAHNDAEVDALEPALAPKTPERPRPVRRTRANPILAEQAAEKAPSDAGEEEQDGEQQPENGQVDEQQLENEQEQEQEDEAEIRENDVPGDGDAAMNLQEEELEEPVLEAPEGSFEDLPLDDTLEEDAAKELEEPQQLANESLLDPASPVATEGDAFSEAPSPRRLTRASSAVSLGDVQPAKRVRRR